MINFKNFANFSHLAIYIILCCITIFKNPVQIILNPRALDRVELSNSLVSYVLYFLVLMLGISVAIKVVKGFRINASDIVNLAFLSFFPIVVIVTNYFNNVNSSRGEVLLTIGVSTLPYLCFKDQRLTSANLKLMIWGLFTLSMLTAIGLGAYFAKSNLIVYTRSSVFGIDRPQLGGTLLQSTEMSNILAIILLLALGTWSVTLFKSGKLAILILCIPILLLFVAMGAVGSIIALSIVITPYLANNYLRRWKMVLLWIILFASLIFVLKNIFKFQSFVVFENLQDKVQTDVRNQMYQTMFEMIKENGFYGSGRLSFFEETGMYPHHNILGLWAELGFFCMLAYICNVALCIFWFIKVISINQRTSYVTLLCRLAACFGSIALYLHLKGFVHDTWHDPFLSLFTASLVGLSSNAYSSIVNNKYDNAKKILFKNNFIK